MPRKRITAKLRRTIVNRAQGCCEYCLSQADFAMQSFSVEHIVPISQGGNDMLDNLALACQGCNGQNLISLRKILYALEEHPPII